MNQSYANATQGSGSSIGESSGDDPGAAIGGRTPPGWPRITKARTTLLAAYYFGSYPLRAIRNHRWTRRGGLPIPVLLYHRVAADADNPWSVTDAAFQRQVHWLRRNVQLISLEEVQRRMEARDSTRLAAAITFDDGYAENCRQALPLLIELGIPCTYFVSTAHILHGTPFPHDLAAGRPLAVNTLSEIRDLAAAGIEIGAHTRTHPDLGRVRDPEKLRDEVITAAHELEDLLGRPIRYFAFPFGQRENMSTQVVELIREFGYRGFCSAYGGLNVPGTSPFHLKRFGPGESLLQVRNWITGDPRMLRRAAGEPRWGAESRDCR